MLWYQGAENTAWTIQPIDNSSTQIDVGTHYLYFLSSCG